MPYFPGFNLTDANGNPITNSGGTAYMREPHASIASIAGGLANLGNLVGPAGVGGAVEDLATTIGAPQETATIAGDVAAVATALAPVAVAILAPEVGVAELVLAGLGAAGTLNQLSQQEQAHYNAVSVNGAYTLGHIVLDEDALGAIAVIVYDQVRNYMEVRIYENNVYTQATMYANLTAQLASLGSKLDGLESDLSSLPNLLELPPTYPGPDDVTLGTPVVVTASTLVDGPMDGALLDWTATPPGAGGRGAGTNVSYYHLGFYTFISSDGYAEDLRYLSWNTHVLTPRSILHPAKLLLYLEKPGCSVTVQPWSLA